MALSTTAIGAALTKVVVAVLTTATEEVSTKVIVALFTMAIVAAFLNE